MSVDKFGRYSTFKVKGGKGPPGEGFKLTSDGDYNIDGKLLRNLEDAQTDNDAVNLGTLKRKLNVYLSMANNLLVWDAKRLRIVNVENPVDNSDAVNFKWIKDHVMSKNKEGWNCRNKRLTNVENPTDDDDAVNKRFLTTELVQKLPKTVEAGLSCENKPLTKVGDPQDEQNAVNLRYLTRHTPGLNTNGYQFNGYGLRNIGDPSFTTDAVSVNYIVRLLSEVIYNIYADMRLMSEGKMPVPVATLNTRGVDKNVWVSRYVVDRYFFAPDKVFKSHI